MRGCNKFCSFCIVPYTQGRERSRPMDHVCDEVKKLVDDGVVHVTLLGQRVDTYGLDLRDGTTLARLLERLHERIPGLLRITFITSHPGHMTADLAACVRDHPRISRYLHLPVQSGSDRMLKAMNRGYTLDEYRRAVDVMRAAVPDLSLAMGRTHQNQIVCFEAGEDLTGRMVPVRITDCSPLTLFGELLRAPLGQLGR